MFGWFGGEQLDGDHHYCPPLCHHKMTQRSKSPENHGKCGCKSSVKLFSTLPKEVFSGQGGKQQAAASRLRGAGVSSIQFKQNIIQNLIIQKYSIFKIILGSCFQGGKQKATASRLKGAGVSSHNSLLPHKYCPGFYQVQHLKSMILQFKKKGTHGKFKK